MKETSHPVHHMAESESTPREYAKFAGIIAAILAITAWLSWADSDIYTWMRNFMAIFFIVFASFKFLDLKVFAYTFMEYDLLAKRSKAYAYSYPFVELGLGLLFAFDLIPLARNIATVLVMAIGAVGVYKELARKSHIKCACLGRYVRLPLTTISLSEDLLMGLMAGYMLIAA